MDLGHARTIERMARLVRIIGMIGCILMFAGVGYLLIGWVGNSPPTIQSEPLSAPSNQIVSTTSPQISQEASRSAITMPSPTPGIVLPPIAVNERFARVPILLYHYVSDNPNKDDKARNGLSTPPSVFKSQLETLKNSGYTTITLDELAAFFDAKSSLPTRPVILTFDDGYSDFYLNVYPILASFGMKGIAFISTGLIGGSAYMTWSQVEEIGRSPFVVIAAHSVHHYVLTKSDNAILRAELEESKTILEQHVPYPINWFAYPYGSFDERVVSAAKAAGYAGAVTTMPGTAQYRSRFFYMPRLRAGTRTGDTLLRYIE